MTETILRVKRECLCEPKFTEKSGWVMRDHRGVRCDHGSTVKVVEYALPEGTYSIGLEAGGTTKYVEECTDGRWSWIVLQGVHPHQSIGDGYVDTLDEAWQAIADAEERWREANR